MSTASEEQLIKICGVVKSSLCMYDFRLFSRFDDLSVSPLFTFPLDSLQPFPPSGPSLAFYLHLKAGKCLSTHLKESQEVQCWVN